MEQLDFLYWYYVWTLLIGSLLYAAKLLYNLEKFRIEHDCSEEAQ